MTSLASQRLPKTHVAPVDHALKASMLQADQMRRATHAAASVTRLLASGAYGPAWAQCWDLGDAARQRLEQLQRGWVQDWFTWWDYCRQIEGAGTLSKFSEREINIVNQALQLASAHTVDLLSLMENVEVDVMHVLSEPAPASEPEARPSASPAPRAAVTPVTA